MGAAPEGPARAVDRPGPNAMPISRPRHTSIRLARHIARVTVVLGLLGVVLLATDSATTDDRLAVQARHPPTPADPRPTASRRRAREPVCRPAPRAHAPRRHAARCLHRPGASKLAPEAHDSRPGPALRPAGQDGEVSLSPRVASGDRARATIVIARADGRPSSACRLPPAAMRSYAEPELPLPPAGRRLPLHGLRARRRWALSGEGRVSARWSSAASFPAPPTSSAPWPGCRRGRATSASPSSTVRASCTAGIRTSSSLPPAWSRP